MNSHSTVAGLIVIEDKKEVVQCDSIVRFPALTTQYQNQEQQSAPAQTNESNE
jgi:hypothetical protein